jgi:hypothetical protein
LDLYIAYDLLQTKRKTCAKFGRNRFRNVDLYKVQTKKQKRAKNIFIYIYIYIWKVEITYSANTEAKNKTVFWTKNMYFNIKY